MSHRQEPGVVNTSKRPKIVMAMVMVMVVVMMMVVVVVTMMI